MQACPPASAAVPAPAGEERGVLVTGSNTPLTLVSSAVTVLAVGEFAEVQLGMTYANETNKDVPVTAALPSPPGWTVVGCEAVYDGHRMQAGFVRAVEKDDRGTKTPSAGAVVVPTASPSGVATIALPYTVTVGTSIEVRVTYLVPLTFSLSGAAQQVAMVKLDLPANLIPTVRRPPPTTSAYNAVFSLLNQAEADHTLRFIVRAQLMHPLRGEVRLETDSCINPQEQVPLPCTVDYQGDSAFELSCTLPLPGDEVSAPYRGGPLRVICDVQSTIEPLRISVAPPVGDGVDPTGDYAAVAATLTATGLEEKVGGLVNSECIFVVDSHHTATSEAVASALALTLRALPPTVKVNVVVLTSGGPRVLYPNASVAVGTVELASLEALVSELNPQPPGTDGRGWLLDGLELLTPQRHRSTHLVPPVPGYVRHLIILSDGATIPAGTAPASVAALLRQVAAASGEARVSAVAITATPTTTGQHAAHGLALLEMLAREGGGCFLEAPTLSGTTTALAQVVAAATVPALTDLRVAFTDAQGSVHPALAAGEPLPAVLSGCSHTVYALASADTPSISVHATGKVGSQVVEFMGTSDGTHQQVLLRAAAAARVQALWAKGCPGPEKEEEAVQLSVHAGVPSPLTRLLLRRAGSADASEEEEPSVAVPPAASFATITAAADSTRCLVQLEQLRRKWLAVLAGRLASADVTTATVEPEVVRLLLLQGRDGGFPLSEDFALAVGVSLDAVEASEPVSQVTSPRTQMDTGKRMLWATVVAVSFMQSQQQPVVALGLRAALAYLQRQCPSGEWKGWMGEAQSLLDRHGGGI